ncbi:MAG: PhnD/SsuA/transferrin family substrate-binding protein [Pseudomonadota bacterium]
MNNLIAEMSMYDWPENRQHQDEFWRAIATQLDDLNIPHPELLSRNDKPILLWKNPNLLIGQTCGWPYANKLRQIVVPFARFDFDLSGCAPGKYNSVFIGREPQDERFLKSYDAFCELKTIAVNGEDSQSGFHVFSELFDIPAMKLFKHKDCLLTQSHRNSIKAVASGKAQIAAIDAVAFQLALKYDPQITDKVFVIGRSHPKPGLPLITSAKNRPIVTALFEAVRRALPLLDETVRERLMIKEVIAAQDADYETFFVSVDRSGV